VAGLRLGAAVDAEADGVAEFVPTAAAALAVAPDPAALVSRLAGAAGVVPHAASVIPAARLATKIPR
jgi:hypothetical protein